MNVDQIFFIVAIETSRRSNIGTALRCAVALGAKMMAVIGSSKYSTHGAHGAQKHIEVLHFYYWEEFQEFSRSQGYKNIFGIARTKGQSTVAADKYFFNESSAFVLGGRDGLTESQLHICDVILHAPLFCKPEIETLLHYDVITSICLHHFVISVGLNECRFEGEKFLLAPVTAYKSDHQSSNLYSTLSPVNQETTTLILAGADENILPVDFFS